MIIFGVVVLLLTSQMAEDPCTCDEITKTEYHIIEEMCNGYDYEIWSDPKQTDGVNDFKKGSMTIYNVNATFKAEWEDSGDFLARIGLKFEKNGVEGKNYKDYGSISAKYAYTRPEYDGTNNVAGGYSYIGIYGWARDPLVEYYIIDDWFGSASRSDTLPVGNDTVCYDIPDYACQVGSFEVDGSEYLIYNKTRGPTYSIDGDDTTFRQYYNVRQNPRKCGTISVSKHFEKWDELEMSLNKMYEAKILVESGGGKGWIDYTYATIEAENFEVSKAGEDNCPARDFVCAGDGAGDGAAWNNRKAWVPMGMLWVVFFLCWEVFAE